MNSKSEPRLVIVSNRVAMPKKHAAAAGGLAVGVLSLIGVWRKLLGRVK